MSDSSPLLNGKTEFFSPKTFYNLSGAAFGVWIACLVINTLFPNIAPFYYRIIAFLLAQLIAIVVVLTSATQRRKLQYWVISFFNAALIFTHASGYNAVTYNLSFEKGLHYDSGNVITKAGILEFDSQVNWWPDTKLLDEKKALIEKNNALFSRNKVLVNQFSYIRDWTLSNLTNVKDRERLLTLLKNFGKSNPELTGVDVEIKNSESDLERINLRFQRDSALMMLRIAEINKNPLIEYDGKRMTQSQFLDSLIVENASLKLQLAESNNRERHWENNFMKLRNAIDSINQINRSKLR